MSLKSLKLSIENQLFFQTLVSEANQGISVADLTGNYVFVNPYFCQMMGYSEAELLQMTVFDMKAPEQDHSSFEQTKTMKENVLTQVLLQKKDGSVFMSEVVGRNIKVNGKAYIFGTVQDISERIATEQALIANEKRKSMVMKRMNFQLALMNG